MQRTFRKIPGILIMLALAAGMMPAAALTATASGEDEIYEETGLDLSERHFAWMTKHPLPEGICDSQTGEGYYPISEE